MLGLGRLADPADQSPQRLAATPGVVTQGRDWDFLVHHGQRSVPSYAFFSHTRPREQQ